MHAQPVSPGNFESVGESWAGVYERLIHTSVARTVGGVLTRIYKEGIW